MWGSKMSQIAFVGNDASLTHLTRRTVCKKGDASFVHISGNPLHSSKAGIEACDLCIVDVQTLACPIEVLVRHLTRINPTLYLLALLPAEDRSRNVALTNLGVDEILLQPTNGNQTDQIIDRLLQRVASLDRLLALKEKLRKEMGASLIVAKSKPMRRVIDKVSKLAQSDFAVLITGETGTGKELMAHAIHYLGPLAGKPFITIDCGALPESLIENELFGHARGAYTDAGAACKGMIQEADGGTLFLDDVEALPLAGARKQGAGMVAAWRQP